MNWKNVAKCWGVVIVVGLVISSINEALGISPQAGFAVGGVAGSIAMLWATGRWNIFG